MDIDKYIAGKAKGLSSITLQGDSTLLVSYPDGFDPTTGVAKPNVERGYQPADIAAMKVGAVQAVSDAQAALDAATRNTGFPPPSGDLSRSMGGRSSEFDGEAP